MFGIPFVGADICGFRDATTPELCLRWLQLGAYYPFSRSHNDIYQPFQDPAYWATIGHDEVTQAAVKALQTRYRLLHYYYTNLYQAQVSGEILIRSLAFEFPKEKDALNKSEQFLIGSSILVSPFLYPVNSFVT